MEIKALGFTTVENAPNGSLLAFPNGTVILKTEYGKNDKPGRDCYIVESGEYYCGEQSAVGMLIELQTFLPTEEGED